MLSGPFYCPHLICINIAVIHRSDKYVMKEWQSFGHDLLNLTKATINYLRHIMNFILHPLWMRIISSLLAASTLHDHRFGGSHFIQHNGNNLTALWAHSSKHTQDTHPFWPTIDPPYSHIGISRGCQPFPRQGDDVQTCGQLVEKARMTCAVKKEWGQSKVQKGRAKCHSLWACHICEMENILTFEA